MTRTVPTRFAVIAAFAIVGVSFAFRLLWLDRLPGINGDEAWYGAQIVRCVHGQPWSGRTPTGLPINPLLFLTEWLLLQFCEPSFWILRLPVCIWSLSGLLLTYVLCRWVYGQTSEALFVVCLTACLPAHLAYSRFCWDGSFAFVSFPLFIFPLLRLLGGHRGATEVALLLAGSILTIWVHATHTLLVIAGLAALAWQFRRACLAFVRRRPITTVGTVLAGTFAITFSIRRSHLTGNLFASVTSSIERLPDHLAGLSEVILGPRVFEYLSGLPVSGWMGPANLLFCVAIAWLLFSMCRWGERTDQQLALLTIGLLVLVLLAGRTLRLHRASYERYILYLVPLLALVTVRGIRLMSGRYRGFLAGLIGPSTSLGLSMICLIQFWYGYFDPLQRQTYITRQHRTFQSGLVEPKAAAAQLIRQASKEAGDLSCVYVEDWWLEHALEYLLDDRYAVIASAVRDEIAGPAFVVGFSGSTFTRNALDTADIRHEHCELWQVGSNDKSSVLTVLQLGGMKSHEPSGLRLAVPRTD